MKEIENNIVKGINKFNTYLFKGMKSKKVNKIFKKLKRPLSGTYRKCKSTF